MQRILPREWILHPDYSWKNNDHDVAIITLETPATFSDTVHYMLLVTMLLHATHVRINNIADAVTHHFTEDLKEFFTLYQTDYSDAPPIMITHRRK